MALQILVLYGSYRQDRLGIRLARFIVSNLAALGMHGEIVDAREVGLPMLDKMYKEYPPQEAPPALAALAEKIRAADGFIFVTGEYNWGPQPGLKNLTDHFLEEWFWRPAAIASYSSTPFGGVRSNFIWHGILSEMGMVVISSTLSIPRIANAFDEDGTSKGEADEHLQRAFPKFAADLAWWAQASQRQRANSQPPY
jgi:NAD(P)H-dependent FMN reductase